MAKLQSNYDIARRNIEIEYSYMYSEPGKMGEVSRLKNPHVLVTGGAGYIGSHAVLALIDAGWPVTVIDDLSTGFRWAVPEDVPFYEGDVGDEDLLARIFAEQGVRAIMHFAGSIVVPESVTNPLKYYGNNTVNSRSLIAAAVSAGVPHFIFSSTAATYGIPKAVPVAEEAAGAPINPYGTSKLMTELMLADAARAHPLNFCALRYFNVAGADPAGRSGQSTAGATHLIKVAVEAALGKRDHVAVYGTDYATPDGSGVRDYIHVSDLAAAHVLALEALFAEPARSLTMNCGYGRGFSVLEVLDAVDRVTGTRVERRIAPRRPGDPDALVADNTRIKATLPWVPRHADLDEIIAHAFAWERSLASASALHDVSV
jgi:UDP-glucose 4-epimerase